MKKLERIPALISFDIEEFDLPGEYGAEITPEEQNAVSAEGARALLDLLEATPGGAATFFVTVRFAEAHPALIRRMVQGGHEVASHGMNHSHFELPDLAESRKYLTELTGVPVEGFRPARLLPVAKEAILEAGYRYESALNPVWLPGRCNHIRAPLTPFREACGLWQLPMTALKGVRLPLFWLTFKNLPLKFYCRLARLAAGQNGLFNMYSHPWEYCERSRDDRWRIPRYMTRHAGEAQLRRLAVLRQALAADCEFMTFRDYIARLEQ